MQAKDKKTKVKFGLIPKILVPVALGYAVVIFIAIFALFDSLELASQSVGLVEVQTAYRAMSDGHIDIQLDYDKNGNADLYIEHIDDDMFDFSPERLEKFKQISDDMGFSITCLDYSNGTPDVVMTCGRLPMDAYTDFYAQDGNLFERGWSTGDVVSGEGTRALWEATWFCMRGTDDKTGKMHAVAIEYDAMETTTFFQKIYTREQNLMIIIAAAVVVLVSVMLILLVRRIKIVNQYLSRIREDSLPEEELKTGFADEITQMSHTINSMVGDLREKNRMSSELTVASDIQHSMLETDFSKIPKTSGIEIFASMNAAKEVGGDLYDFFMIDDNRLGFFIADVSGKGVPAALFMAMSKSILRDEMHAEIALDEQMSLANDAISDSNSRKLFVTVWAGCIDLRSGLLTYVNAAHDRPLFKRNDGSYEFLPERHGPVMGIRPGTIYKKSEIQLMPGDKLFLYTDGVTEAQTGENCFYGKERLKNCLNENSGLGPKNTVNAVIESISAFAGAAEQFDDITMFMIEYHGKQTE